MINEPEKEEIVWHYTKMATIEKIFPPKIKNDKENKEYNGKINIRFTNARYTNDPSEALVLKEVYKKNREAVLGYLKTDFYKKIFEDYIDAKQTDFDGYIFSTTKLYDSFAFWSKEYAGIDGIMIGINKNNMERQIEGEKFIFSKEVLYSPYQKLPADLIKNLLEFTFDIYEKHPEGQKSREMLLALLDYNSHFFKHTAWKYEEEVRFMLVNSFGQQSLKMRNTSIPITEYVGNKIMRTIYRNFTKDVIDCLVVGPGCGYEQQEAIEKYLKENGYNNDNSKEIEVFRSSALDLKYDPSESKEDIKRRYLRDLLRRAGF